MIDDDLDDSAAAVLGLELLNRTEQVEGMPPQPMAKRRHRSPRATVPRTPLQSTAWMHGVCTSDEATCAAALDDDGQRAHDAVRFEKLLVPSPV